MGEMLWRDVVDKQACTELVYRLARGRSIAATSR